MLFRVRGSVAEVHRVFRRGIGVPREKVSVTTTRASGPGGQHVNTTNTKVVLRLDVGDGAHSWLPERVRQRLLVQQRSHVSKRLELIISADESRSQERNLAAALQRLQTMVDQAVVEPYVRKVTEPPAHVKRERLREKRTHSARKQRRRESVDF